MMLFAWVNAQKSIVPTITISQAIQSYINYFDLDEWDMESAMSTYTRLQKDYHKG